MNYVILFWWAIIAALTAFVVAVMYKFWTR